LHSPGGWTWSAAVPRRSTYYEEAARALLERARDFEQESGDKSLPDGGFARREVLRDFLERQLNVQLTEKMAETVERLSRNPRVVTVESLAGELELMFKAT
jgi:hypothetical protein